VAIVSEHLAAAQELWQRALADLQLQMTRATFDTWLRGTRVVEADAGSLTVGVGNAYALDWLNQRLMPLIQRTIDRRNGEPLQIRFLVRSSIDDGPPLPVPEPEQGCGEVIMEAVQEERVSLRDDGTVLLWTDIYVKLKVAFRRRVLRELKGAALSVWVCLALHMDKYGVSSPGVSLIMEETGYHSRTTVCSALEDLVHRRLVEKLNPNRYGNDRYRILGYAWFGRDPAPALFELEDD
jgi:hypothetical protein